MSVRSSCGGFGGFAGTAHGFPWIWCVFMFVWFGFDKGIMQRVEFDWVGGVEGGCRLDIAKGAS